MLARRDPTDIARALAVLAQDDDLRIRMGNVGRRRAAAFATSVAAGKLLEHYEMFLDNNDRASGNRRAMNQE